MGLMDSVGLSGVLPEIDLMSMLGTVGFIIFIVLLFVLVAGIFFAILWFIKQKKLYNKKIHWFEEVSGIMTHIDDDVACELTIPNSNIQVFYIKKKDLYLPRPVKRMGKDAYWFCIRNNREIVNFTLKNMNREMEESNLDFDHTDQRYALTNLKALIQRNYRDKSTKWWMEYKEVIGLVVLIFALTLSFMFLISKIAELMDKAAILIDHADQLVKSAEAIRGSGVKPA